MDNNELEKDVVVSEDAAPDTKETTETNETVETAEANEAAETTEVLASVAAEPEKEEEVIHYTDAPISL